MRKELENLLCCPLCGSNIENNENKYYSCLSCKSNFDLFDEIVDFRNIQKDSTKAFSIKDDLEISNILLKNFNKFNNFNGLLKFYEELKKFKSTNEIDEIHINEILKTTTKNFDLPMSNQQSLHGYDILKKINLFKNEFKFKDYQNKICLENGCGHGLFVEGLSNNFETLIVIDFSMSYLLLAKKICQEKNISNIIFLCASVENLPIKNNIIDLIHSNNVIEHVSNQAKMIKETNRVLSYEGLLFLLSPNKNSAYFEPHYRLVL